MRPAKLDRIDLKILVELQKNGRITNAELADRVGLSPSPCLLRVRRLETGGYITGYGASVDLAKLGDLISVFTEITLTDHCRAGFARFEEALHGVEEVMECHLISGSYDYLLKFVTRSIAHYQETMESLLQRDIGIDKYFSYVVIRSSFVRSYYPPTRLVGES